jgi:hypothetical protein
MTLTAEAVDLIMHRCLFTEDELSSAGAGIPPEGAVIVDGIVQKFGFHPGRIMENKEAIRLLLAELPVAFRHNGGGGWSFLQGCMDRNDRQWGEHRNVEALLVLGLASGLATYLLPREVWGSLPGGMPYFMVLVS